MKPSPGLSSGVSRDTISLDCCGDWATLRSRQPRKYVTEYMKRPTKLGRLCFCLGLLIYVASFWLTAVGGPGVWTLRPPSMATWIIEAFFSPLIHLHQSRIETFLEDLTVQYVCWHFERMDQSGVFSYHGFHASGQDTQVDQNI